MPLVPDEEDFDSRLPPWVYADGAGIELPEAMLSEDAGPTQADPQGLDGVAPQPWQPEVDSQQQQSQWSTGPSFKQRIDSLKKESRQETRRLQRETEVEGRATQRGRVQAQRARDEVVSGERPIEMGQNVAQSWRPPIFDQFQAVNTMAGADDEVSLGDAMTIARADPTTDMNSAMDLAEAASQSADVSAEQSRYLHNAMSRLRDTEVGFMTKNYV